MIPVKVLCVRILNVQLLIEFMKRDRQASDAIQRWMRRVRASRWPTPHDARSRMPGMRRLRTLRHPGHLLIFGIMDNEFRIIADADYQNGTLTIVFVGAHAAYERMLRRLR